MTRLLLAAAVAALAAPLAAQTYAAVDDVQASAPGYYTFARSGERVVSVTAVGAVGASGRYSVGAGATVADLLALAGGAAPDRAGSAVVRLYRDGDRAVESPVRDLYRAGAAPIVLRDGDVVEVVGLTSTAPGFYVHTSPDAAPVVVTAAGAVAAPGRFAVDPGATVADLLALAGGTAVGERDAAVETTTTVRLHRAGAVAFEAPLAATYARPTPALEAGDVVELDVVHRRRASFTWRDALSIVTGAVAVVIAVDRVAE